MEYSVLGSIKFHLEKDIQNRFAKPPFHLWAEDFEHKCQNNENNGDNNKFGHFKYGDRKLEPKGRRGNAEKYSRSDDREQPLVVPRRPQALLRIDDRESKQLRPIAVFRELERHLADETERVIPGNPLLVRKRDFVEDAQHGISSGFGGGDERGSYGVSVSSAPGWSCRNSARER